jgi:hypothetical protein
MQGEHTQAKNDEALAALGGAAALAAALACSLATGVDPDHAGAGGHSLAARREAFGANRFKEVPVQPFWRLLVDNLSDPTLILLMCAAAVRAPGAGSGASGHCGVAVPAATG